MSEPNFSKVFQDIANSLNALTIQLAQVTSALQVQTTMLQTILDEKQTVSGPDKVDLEIHTD